MFKDLLVLYVAWYSQKISSFVASSHVLGSILWCKRADSSRYKLNILPRKPKNTELVNQYTGILVKYTNMIVKRSILDRWQKRLGAVN